MDIQGGGSTDGRRCGNCHQIRDLQHLKQEKRQTQVRTEGNVTGQCGPSGLPRYQGHRRGVHTHVSRVPCPHSQRAEQVPGRGGIPSSTHRWELPVIHYHKIMVIYHYPFVVVIIQFFSWIILINDCICILTGSPG